MYLRLIEAKAKEGKCVVTGRKWNEE